MAFQEITSALDWLDGHINVETGARHWVNAGTPGGTFSRPGLDRMRRLCHNLGDPQNAFPALHITGTNGKGSTSRLVSSLLGSRGLSVGTYLSPHLERVNERIEVGGVPLSDIEFASQVQRLKTLEEMSGERHSWFELVTAVAFLSFLSAGVDVAVVEVGAGGRWDATNIVNGRVAVITNIELDHTEWFGSTRRDVAREKIGIVKPRSTLLIGERSPEIVDYLVASSAEASRVWRIGADFGCSESHPVSGGRLCNFWTPNSRYSDVLVGLVGAHQADNASIALAAVEAFCDAPSEEGVVREAFAKVNNPGRTEVIRKEPTVVLDGAHNPAGARSLAHTLRTELRAEGRRVFVLGFLNSREPGEMIDAFEVSPNDLIIACAPNSPRALDPIAVARCSAERQIPAIVASSVPGALAHAITEGGPDATVVVCGSLYLVGEARAVLRSWRSTEPE